MKQLQKSLVISMPAEYRGKFVAYRIEKRRVKIIDSSEDFEKLLQKLKERGFDPRFVLIDYVPEEDIIYLI